MDAQLAIQSRPLYEGFRVQPMLSPVEQASHLRAADFVLCNSPYFNHQSNNSQTRDLLC